MLGSPRILTVVALLFAATTGSMAEQPPVFKDESWGFSYESTGLGRPGRIAASVFDTVIDEKSGSCLRVFYNDVPEHHGPHDDEADEYDSLTWLKKRKAQPNQDEKPEEIEETTLAGMPAYKLRLNSPEGIKTFYVTKNEPDKAWWEILVSCHGKNRADFLQIAEAAVASFRPLKPGDAPSEERHEQVCQRGPCRSRIVTQGFTGKVRILTDATLAIAGLTDEPGHLFVQVETATETIDECRKRLKQLQEKSKDERTVESCIKQGRDALRYRWVQAGGRHDEVRLEEILIWDGNLLWTVSCHYKNGLSQAGVTTLTKALESFKLLREPGK